MSILLDHYYSFAWIVTNTANAFGIKREEVTVDEMQQFIMFFLWKRGVDVNGLEPIL